MVSGSCLAHTLPFCFLNLQLDHKHKTFPYFQVGDWTNKLFRLCLEDSRMPLWISAAQPSVVKQALYFDNGEQVICFVRATCRSIYVVYLAPI